MAPALHRQATPHEPALLRRRSHRMCRRVAPSALSTLTPSSPTACIAWLPLSTTSSGEMGWPSLYSRHELTFTAGRHARVAQLSWGSVKGQGALGQAASHTQTQQSSQP